MYQCHCKKQFTEDHDRSIHARSCRLAVDAIIDGKDWPEETDQQQEIQPPTEGDLK